jgi:hypothetical protein
MDLIDKFKSLPEVLIHKITDYADIIVYRNGKYMNRINKNDLRYDLLKKISRPIYVGKHYILLRLMGPDLSGYFLEYDTRSIFIKVNVRFFYRIITRFEKYFDYKSNDTYIFTINNQWYKLISYPM